MCICLVDMPCELIVKRRGSYVYMSNRIVYLYVYVVIYMYMYKYEFAVRTHLYYIYTYMYTFSFYICFYLYAVRTQREEAAHVVNAAAGYNDVESARSNSCSLHFHQFFYFVFIMRTLLLLILQAIFKSISPVAGWILQGANLSPNLQARFSWLILPVCRLQWAIYLFLFS